MLDIGEIEKEIAEELQMLRIPREEESLTSQENTTQKTTEMMVQEKQTHFKDNREQITT